MRLMCDISNFASLFVFVGAFAFSSSITFTYSSLVCETALNSEVTFHGFVDEYRHGESDAVMQ